MKSPAVRCAATSEFALVVEFGDRIDRRLLDRVWAFARYLDRYPLAGMVEYVTSYTTVTIFFQPSNSDCLAWECQIQQIVAQLDVTTAPPTRQIEIPVRYGGAFGPDLEFVAQHAELSTDEVIRLHASAEYLVYLIGFVPGFPYLGGMSPRLAVPRLDSPRPQVPAGSVGIAGDQTGVYPLSTPGGWRLIGRTPLTLFDATSDSPCLVLPGDTVRFVPITLDEFHSLSSSGAGDCGSTGVTGGSGPIGEVSG